MPSRPADTDVTSWQASTLLASPHPFVLLVGPHGTGKSTALHAYAREQAAVGRQVTWFTPGAEPGPGTELLLLDDVQTSPPSVWEELQEWDRRRPGLQIRACATTAALITAGADVVVHDMPFLDTEAVGVMLAAHGSAAAPDLVRWVTGGHPESVQQIARSGALTEVEMRAALATVVRIPRLSEGEEFLAVPTHLSAALVTELGGPVDFLARVESAGHGYWTGTPGRRLFALLPTVREATLAGLSGTTTARTSGILATSAQFHLDGDAPYAAFGDAVRADRLDLADRAVKLGGVPMLVDHGFAISALLRPLSRRALGSHPALAFALALVLNARREHRLRALEVLAVAVVAARVARGSSAADRSLTRVVESVALRVSGAADSGLAAATQAAGTLAEMTPEERLELGSLAGDLHTHSGISLLYGGLDEEAFEQFELALGTEPRPGVELMALGGLAAVEALRGDLSQSQEWVETAHSRRWPENLLHGYAGCLLRVAEAHLGLERIDPSSARAALDTVWSMIETTEHWPLLAEARALADLLEGNAAAGLEEFRGLRRRRTGRLGTTDWVRRRLDATESLLLLGVGEAGAAKNLLGNGRQSDVLLARARVALVLDDRDAALSLLGRAQPVGPRSRMTAAALRAVLLRRQGREPERRLALEQIEALRRRSGSRLPLLLLPYGERAHFGELGEGMPEVLAPVSTAPKLTERELVVLRELVVTRDIGNVAENLHVSVNTVKSQRRSLYRKLGASSREEAITAALGHGLLGE